MFVALEELLKYFNSFHSVSVCQFLYNPLSKRNEAFRAGSSFRIPNLNLHIYTFRSLCVSFNRLSDVIHYYLTRKWLFKMAAKEMPLPTKLCFPYLHLKSYLPNIRENAMNFDRQCFDYIELHICCGVVDFVLIYFRDE